MIAKFQYDLCSSTNWDYLKIVPKGSMDTKSRFEY